MRRSATRAGSRWSRLRRGAGLRRRANPCRDRVVVYASLPMEANQPEPQIVNLTPEPLVLRQLRAAGPALITVLPSGRVARAEERIEIVGDVRGVPIVRVAYAAIVDLPNPEPGARYVVSRLVADV